MNPRSVILLSALLATSAFAGTADTQSNANAAESKPHHGDCIFTRSIDGWTVLNDQSLIVYAPNHNRPYLIKLFRPEFALRSEWTLGFLDRDSNGMICDGGPDYIVVREFGRGFSNRIPIDTVERIEPAQAKELIAKSKEKPENPAVVMPEPSDMKSDKEGAQKSGQPTNPDQPRT
ncbi:MAG TPA: DUF6491 family protein [Steroidobacteraceae bacterium]|jgi:hypothetical protein|nr:DUF6491 family protein [Steroidobacteraceae bacterium]